MAQLPEGTKEQPHVKTEEQRRAKKEEQLRGEREEQPHGEKEALMLRPSGTAVLHHAKTVEPKPRGEKEVHQHLLVIAAQRPLVIAAKRPLGIAVQLHGEKEVPRHPLVIVVLLRAKTMESKPHLVRRVEQPRGGIEALQRPEEKEALQHPLVIAARLRGGKGVLQHHGEKGVMPRSPLRGSKWQ